MSRKKIPWMTALCLICALAAACGSPGSDSGTGGSGAAASSQTSGEREPASESVRLTAGIVSAVDHPHTLYLQEFANRVREATGGAVTIDVFPANQLGEERDITVGLTEGTIDFTLNANGELSKRVEGYSICDAPYLFNGPEEMQEIVMGELFQPLHEDLRENHGIRVMSSFYLGTRHVTTSNKEIRTPDDLTNFKIRVPDQQPSINAFLMLGASPTPIPFGELYLALQQGLVDGQENSFSQILGNKIEEVQSYLCLTGHVVQNLYLTVSELTYQKLTPEQQEILQREAVAIAAEVTAEIIRLEEGEQLQTLRDAGMEVIEVDTGLFRQKALDNMEGSGFDPELYSRIQSMQ